MPNENNPPHVTVTAVRNAAVNVGNNNTITQTNIENNFDPAILVPMFTTLEAAINNLEVPAAKADCATDLAALKTAVAAPAPDKSLITKLLDKLESAPKYIAGGAAVITAVQAIAAYVASLAI
jgi:hypothetical protein